VPASRAATRFSLVLVCPHWSGNYAGQYTFSLGNATGGLQLVRLAPGYTQAQLLSDVGAVFRSPSPGAKAAAERLCRPGSLRWRCQRGDEVLGLPHPRQLRRRRPQRPRKTVLSTGVLSTNETMTMPYILKGPGTYAIACFVTTPETGQPHAMLGMIRVLPPVR